MYHFVCLKRAICVLAGALCASVASAAAPVLGPPLTAQPEPATNAIPDFMAPGTGWTMINSNATDYVDPPSGPKPVTNDPKYPHVGNLQPGQKTERVADLTNPILQDWMKPQMQKYNQEVIAGTIPFVATSLCWPGGVPAQLLVPTTVYFIQKPDEVVMIWERDQLVRHVYLNKQHTKNPRPTWFGESVGHYENGDTLVVDTVGLSTKTFVDQFRTPHSDKLHVIERWRLTAGGKTIEIEVTIDDPDTFNQVWKGMVRLQRGQEPFTEFVCSEGNHNLFDYGIPVADRPDV